MRILHVTEAAGGGVLGVVRFLAAEGTGGGHEVAVAHGRRPETPARLADVMPDDVETVELPWRRRTPKPQVDAALALRRLVRSWRPDVVHLHSSFAGAVGALAAGELPKVYTPHGYSFARRPDGSGRLAAYRAVERMVARRCDVIAAVSEAEATLARDVVGARWVRVVANGIPELDAPAPQIADRNQPLVVGAGRFCAARRPEATTRILTATAEHARVRWIGDAPDGEDALLRGAGIPVTGWLAHGDALDELARATVLLHWSEWDGAPLAVLEAMARDVVVVASDIPANRELVGAAQVRADEAGAVGLIRAVLADAGLRAELLASQRERAASRGAARMAKEYAELYADVVHARRSITMPVPPAPATATRA